MKWINLMTCGWPNDGRCEQLLAEAENGSREAQYWVGYYFVHGEGVVPKDEAQGVRWLARAARQDSGKAQYRLGECYRWGLGFGGDEEEQGIFASERMWLKSIQWLMVEAHHGDAESAYLLGWAYQYATGIEQDHESALYWIQRAAGWSHPKAQTWLGCAYQNGYHGLLERDLRLGFGWLQTAGFMREKRAQHEIGRCYQYGIGVPQKNWMLALEWYEKSVQNGHELAPISRDALIRDKRTHLERKVKESLEKSVDMSPTSPSLGLWGHGLASLAAHDQQPAGYSPIFLALTRLTPFIFKYSAPRPNFKTKWNRGIYVYEQH